jgi:hypothetical protein
VEERGTAPSERPCGKLRARELQFARETSLVINCAPVLHKSRLEAREWVGIFWL